NWVFKGRSYLDCDANGVHDGFELASGAADLNGNAVLDVCEPPIGYCTATPNSSGQAATLNWGGSTNIALNDFVLYADSCPPNAFGVFAVSEAPASVPFGDGVLCVSAPITRLSAVSANAIGSASLLLDNDLLTSGASPIAPGSQRCFTFFFRDAAGGPAGFNLSNGLSVTFL
ncbi:MAG: hypothetical protein KDC14_11930, partial [Planctomycetes bacterium]|nr:hypothetical protein [Planctomycetota bacterium]